MSGNGETGVPAGATVEVDGVRLAYAREGRGLPLVCLHAIGHGGGDFADLARRLRDRCEVIRIDWPGQGRSGPDRQPASAERYADLLAGALAQLGVRDPVILGNSIGGAAAILHAQRHSVAGLVLCDAGGLVPVNGFVRAVCAAFAAFFGAGERGAKWFGRAFALYYRFMVLPAAAAAAQRERIVGGAYAAAPVLRQAWQSFALPQADLRAQAAALDVPVWCAWSRSDRVIPLWMCRPAIRRLRRGSLDVFRGGHAAFLEDPAAFTTALVRFLDALPGQAGATAPASRPQAAAA